MAIVMIKTEILWEKNKDNLWMFAKTGKEFSLEDLLSNAVKPSRREREEFDYHQSSFAYWMGIFENAEAASQFPLLVHSLDGLEIEDGNHRLVAAKAIGLPEIAVTVWDGSVYF